MIHCERKNHAKSSQENDKVMPRRSLAGASSMRGVRWACYPGLQQDTGGRFQGQRAAWRLPMETASAQAGEAAGALKSKIYQQLATLSKLGWTGKDFTFTFIYKCAVWNSYSKVLLLSLLKNHLFPHGWTFWNVKSKSGTQRVHFKENSGHCRAHNAACIRFPTLKINEEPRKNFT